MTETRKNVFMGMTSGQLFIHSFLFAYRIATGEGFYSAFGKFVVAFILSFAICYIASKYIAKWLYSDN